MNKNIIYFLTIIAAVAASFTGGYFFGKQKTIKENPFTAKDGFDLKDIEKYHLFFVKDDDGSVSIEGLDPDKLVKTIDNHYYVEGVQRLNFDKAGDSFYPILFSRNESGERISFFSALRDRANLSVQKCVCIYTIPTGSTMQLQCSGSKLELRRAGETDPIFTTKLNQIVYLNSDAAQIVIGVAQQEEFEKGKAANCNCKQ